MKGQRVARIDHEIQRVLGMLLTRDLTDPRLAFTTVTRVHVSPDLRHAKVYVSIIGDRHAARQTMDALRGASGFLRGELGREIELRYTPDLQFIEDRTTERAVALSKTLREAGAGES